MVQGLLIAAPVGAALQHGSWMTKPDQVVAHGSSPTGTSSIFGVVTDSTGAGVSGVCIKASSPGFGEGDTVTDANGNYTVSGLAAGGFQVVADGTCGGTQTSPYETQRTRSLVTLVTGASFQVNFSFVLGGGSISGQITDPNGAGVAGVCLSAYQGGEGDGYGFAVTDANGNYTVSALAPGSYSFNVQPGCMSPSTYSWQIFNPETVTTDATTTQNAVLFVADNSISGQVTKSVGVGLPNVCIYVGPASGGAGATGSTITDANGNYTVSGLPPGMYDMYVDPLCDLQLASPFEGQHLSVTVVEGSSPTVANVTLPEGGMVSGQVTNSTGAAVPGVCVNDQIENSTGWITSDVAGNYTVSALAPGSFTEFADPTCNGTKSSTYISQYQVNDPVVVTSEQTTTNENFVLEQGASTPAPPPSGVSASAFGSPTSVVTSAQLPTLIALGYNGETETLSVPTDALGSGTTVSAYPITNPSALDVSSVPGSTYVDGFGITWDNGGSTSPASSPITLTMSDPSIVPGDSIWIVTSTGPVLVPSSDAVITNGSATVTFTSDPVFLVLHTVLAVQSSLSVSTSSGRLGTPLALTTSGGSGTGAVTYTVVDGTAMGCEVSGSRLTASSVGTCVVTATKASDSSYFAGNSAPTTVTLAPRVRPAALSMSFTAGSSAVSPAAKRSLLSLSKKLRAGDSVVVTGYAKDNPALAKSRASAVARYLLSRVRIHERLKAVTHVAMNEVTVTTTKL
jgi:hypothetical protein